MANRNQTTLGFVIDHDGNHSEWITVISFYKALHIVEAAFAEVGPRHGRNHESREALLKHDRRFNHIYRHYRPLWAASTVARYLAEFEARCAVVRGMWSPDELERRNIGGNAVPWLAVVTSVAQISAELGE